MFQEMFFRFFSGIICRLKAQPRSARAGNSTTRSKMSYCTDCGQHLREESLFCPQCGKKIRDTPAPAPTEPRRNMTPRSRVIAKVLIAMVLIFGLSFFVRELTRADHPVIAKQPVVAQPIDYASAKIEMTDVPSRVEDGKVIFSLDDVRKHGLVRIQYKGRVSVTPVLAYISGEGKLVTAISRSEPDNATTFSIEGTSIKCGNCPANWQINNMKANACCPRNFPDPIPSTVVGSEVHIVEDIVANWTSRL